MANTIRKLICLLIKVGLFVDNWSLVSVQILLPYKLGLSETRDFFYLYKVIRISY